MSASKHRRKGKTRARANSKTVPRSSARNVAEDKEKIPDADDLMLFLRTVYNNQRVNPERLPEHYHLIQQINNNFVTAHQALVDPKPAYSGVLCLRSEYAFKAAAGMALAGQAGEAFSMMRLCLEHAGYALRIFAEPALEKVFLHRHVDDTIKKAQKAAFTITNIRQNIADFDSSLAVLFQQFYDRTIDLGAHPNPAGVFNMAKIEKPQDNVSGGIIALALTTDDLSLRHAMQHTAQVGLIALLIFGHIFSTKFESLGIRAEIDALRCYLLYSPDAARS
jgi:hypothetical protein